MAHLIDNFGADIYCHDIVRIDVLGPNRRLVFTVPNAENGSGEYQNVICKLILPAELLTKLAYMSAGADAQSTSHVLLAADADGWRN